MPHAPPPTPPQPVRMPSPPPPAPPSPLPPAQSPLPFLPPPATPTNQGTVVTFDFDSSNSRKDWTLPSSIGPNTYAWRAATRTPSAGTGPQAGDHTTGNGHFMYTEVSSP